MKHTTGETVRFIFKCYDCKKVFALDFIYAGKDRKGYTIYSIGDKSSQYPASYAVCPECHSHWVSYREVSGAMSNHECNETCTHAEGYICKCSCGGRNHGAAYLETPKE